MRQDDRLINLLDAHICILKRALNKHNALTYHDHNKSIYEHAYFSELLKGFEFAKEELTKDRFNTLESCSKFILATISEGKRSIKSDNPYKLASIETKSRALMAVVSRLHEWDYCLDRLDDNESCIGGEITPVSR
jgi:hypothetical protein